MSRDDVLAFPAYLGMMRLGALSPDHVNLSMSTKDVERYPGMARWKKPKRNLNAVG